MVVILCLYPFVITKCLTNVTSSVLTHLDVLTYLSLQININIKGRGTIISTLQMKKSENREIKQLSKVSRVELV